MLAYLQLSGGGERDREGEVGRGIERGRGERDREGGGGCVCRSELYTRVLIKCINDRVNSQHSSTSA